MKLSSKHYNFLKKRRKFTLSIFLAKKRKLRKINKAICLLHTIPISQNISVKVLFAPLTNTQPNKKNKKQQQIYLEIKD